jgi:hypothetical protein
MHSLGDRAISKLVVVIVSHDDLADAELGGHLLAFGSGDAPDGLASGHASTRHLDSATMERWEVTRPSRSLGRNDRCA